MEQCNDLLLSDNQTIASKCTIPNAQSISHLSVVQSIDFKSAPSWNVTIVYLFVLIIPVAHGFPFPAFPALRNPWVFASSWFRGLIWNLSCFIVNSTNFKARSIFSFLNLSYIKEWSGKYSPFLELSRCLMSKRHILSYQVLLAQIVKMKLLSQMNSVDQVKGVAVLAGHLENWTQWPIVVTQVPIERSYHTRTLTHCGHKANKPSRCTRWRECQTTTEFANYSDIE